MYYTYTKKINNFLKVKFYGYINKISLIQVNDNELLTLLNDL